MKKVFIVFIICVLVISSTFFFTRYEFDLPAMLESVQEFASGIFNGTPATYDNTVKVNRLQMSDATYNYNKLSDFQKQMYSSIAHSVKGLKSNAYLQNTDSKTLDEVSEDAKVVMSAFFADHPEVFYLKLTYKVSLIKSVFSNSAKIELSYSINNFGELEDTLKKIETEIDLYVENLSSKTSFEKELILHDKLATSVKYYMDKENIDEVPDEYHSIYGTFIEKKAVCDGFSKAMQLLLDKVGIENIFITGKIGDVAHAWNMVKLDSNWYHLDLTSNKYIKETDGSTKYVVHTYFNVTDDFILKSHTIDNKSANPVANNKAYNYYIKTNCHISSTQDFDNRIKEIIKLQSASSSLEFSADMFDVPTKLLKVLYSVNFNGYKDSGNSVKMKYYSEQNTYIVIKN